MMLYETFLYRSNRHHRHLQFNTCVLDPDITHSVRGQAFVHTAWPTWAGRLLPNSTIGYYYIGIIDNQPLVTLPFGESSHLVHHRDIETSFGGRRMPSLTPLAVLIPAIFWWGVPLESQISPEKHQKNTKIKKMHQIHPPPPPPVMWFPRKQARIHTAPLIGPATEGRYIRYGIISWKPLQWYLKFRLDDRSDTRVECLILLFICHIFPEKCIMFRKVTVRLSKLSKTDLRPIF